MPTPQTDLPTLQATVDAYNGHNRNKAHAAKALGLDRGTFRSRLVRAAERGLLLDHPPAMPGFRVSRLNDGPHGKSVEQKPEHGGEFTVPVGHAIKGVSALIDQDGREIVKWVKTREDRLDPLQVVEWIKASFADWKPAAPIAPITVAPESDFLTLYPLADWHLGMFAWHRETGENWDIKIAEAAIGLAMDDVIARSPPSATAVVLGGGDLVHVDNNRNETAHGTRQNADGRYHKMIFAAIRLVVRTIDAALRRHGHVIVRILPGNHDEHASVAVAYSLHAWYRNDPRVTVDTDPSLFWWHRFGRVMLGATHGHTVKITKMPAIMAARRAEDWGSTQFRYIHGFHLHHVEKGSNEEAGALWEVHRSPVPQDSWHYGSGFLSGRSVKAITYHRELGWHGEVGTPMRDGARQ
jgi:hypothetical protein